MSEPTREGAIGEAKASGWRFNRNDNEWQKPDSPSKKQVKNTKKKEMAKKMSNHKKMETKGYRYVAAQLPKEGIDRVKYYKNHKGRYVKNVIGKDGKYVTPQKKKIVGRDKSDWFMDNTDIEHTY